MEHQKLLLIAFVDLVLIEVIVEKMVKTKFKFFFFNKNSKA
jgi:hypothetical protein